MIGLILSVILAVNAPIIVIDGDDGPTTCITFPSGEVVCN